MRVAALGVGVIGGAVLGCASTPKMPPESLFKQAVIEVRFDKAVYPPTAANWPEYGAMLSDRIREKAEDDLIQRQRRNKNVSPVKECGPGVVRAVVRLDQVTSLRESVYAQSPFSKTTGDMMGLVATVSVVRCDTGERLASSQFDHAEDSILETIEESAESIGDVITDASWAK